MIIVIAVAAAVVCIGLGAAVCVRRRNQKAAGGNLRPNRVKRAVASTVNPTCAVTGVVPASRTSIDLHAGCLEVTGENATYAEIAELSAGHVTPPAAGTAVHGGSPAGTRLVYAVNPVVGAPRGRYDSFDPTRTADGENAYAMPLAADDGSSTTIEPAGGLLYATVSKRGGPPPAGAYAMPLDESGV